MGQGKFPGASGPSAKSPTARWSEHRQAGRHRSPGQDAASPASAREASSARSPPRTSAARSSMPIRNRPPVLDRQRIPQRRRRHRQGLLQQAGRPKVDLTAGTGLKAHVQSFDLPPQFIWYRINVSNRSAKANDQSRRFTASPEATAVNSRISFACSHGRPVFFNKADDFDWPGICIPPKCDLSLVVLNFWGEEEDLGAVRQRGDCRRPIFLVDELAKALLPILPLRVTSRSS